jgi:hypothetical protein
MDKTQALQSFFSKFGVKAYDSSTVPDDAVLPRITYEVMIDGFGAQNVITASIWDRSTSWKSVTDILSRIEEELGDGAGSLVPYSNGAFWIKKSHPFAQRMSDTDESIRRYVLNFEIEYLTEV